MGHGVVIPKEVQVIIVHLSAIFYTQQISMYTGVPLHSVQRILAYYNEHGTVKALDEERNRVEKLPPAVI